MSLNISCNQWFSLAKPILKVTPADRNRTLMANTSKCGWAIRLSENQELEIQKFLPVFSHALYQNPSPKPHWKIKYSFATYPKKPQILKKQYSKKIPKTSNWRWGTSLGSTNLNPSLISLARNEIQTKVSLAMTHWREPYYL